MRLLAIDLGYSSVKIAYYDENNVMQFEKFISATAKVDKPLEADDDTLFQLGPDYYILGTSALKVPRSLLFKLETYEDMKLIYPVWISYLLKRYGGIDNFDHVIVGLSLAFQDKADDLLDYLYETLNITKQEFFSVMPQGLCCKLSYQEFGLNLREASKKNDVKMRNYLLVDGGFLSIDAAQVLEGKSSAGAAIGIAQTGIINIAFNIVDYLYQTYEMKVAVKEAQVILDNNGIFIRRGREYNISDKVAEFTKAYLVNVLKLLEDRFSESLDTIEGILVCGGLAYFFKKYINDPGLIKEIEKHFPVTFIKLPQEGDCEFFNAASYLRIAEKVLK